MGLVLGKVSLQDNDSLHKPVAGAVIAEQVEKFFFTDLPRRHRFAGASKQRCSNNSKRMLQLRTDSSLGTESTKGSPELGDYHYRNPQQTRRNQNQESSVQQQQTTTRPGWFRRPTEENSNVPPPPRHRIHKTTQQPFAPSSSSSTSKRRNHRAKAQSSPLPAARCTVVLREKDTAENQKKLYDMRTWDMYMRITQARQNQKPAVATASGSSSSVYTQHDNAAAVPAMGDAAAATDGSYGHFLQVPESAAQEKSQSLFLEDTSGDHEMIFGDLE